MSNHDIGVRVHHLRKTFRHGEVLACDDVNLDIAQGELLVLLGPSGCGKTTTLRCIAGLELPDNDDAIWVNGKNMTRIAPKDRNLAFVFQETAMFPHLTVRRNISFGLDMRRKVNKAEINRRVEEAAQMLKLQQLLDRYPRELSGGQGQRVALGRAIVTEPDAFLLDEPLAALDAALRVEMRTEIKLIQRRLKTAMIFVTHDQEEALTIGDKIAVMKDGVVQQEDTPHQIYHRPVNLFVGTFIGSPPINQFQCSLQDDGITRRLISRHFNIALPDAIAQRLKPVSALVILGLRPEFLRLGDSQGDFTGVVKLTELLGSRTLVLIESEGEEIRALVQGASRVKEGDHVSLSLDLEKAFYFDENGMALI